MPASSSATDSSSLLESFEPLEDPRHGEIYPLEEIVMLVICATISGADLSLLLQGVLWCAPTADEAAAPTGQVPPSPPSQ